ncbi:hypothetical protein GIB67_032751 [Kingdonia uniflora]|uniref:Uncharacterized protein n=1 Tax=Kingdonia uniflora TaxID=39325 RepID=A0A7J7MWC3_9MAGN|nr:hypothetical protein GIB67_032751 [Kingdonia uniflora]
MTGDGGSKKRGADGERQVVWPKVPGVDFVDMSESTTSSKLARVFPKKEMLKRGSTSGTTESGEVKGEAKKRRDDPPFQLTEVKASEDRLGEEDELKVVEDRAKLAVHNGEKKKSKIAALLMKGICLGVEVEKAKLEKGKAEFVKKVAHLKVYLAMEGKRLDSLKASQKVEINELTAKAGNNLEEVLIQRDRLGSHLLKMRYSKTEVNDIMTDTYVKEEEDDEAEDVAVGVAELELPRLSEEETRQCNQEFAAEFDRMR